MLRQRVILFLLIICAFFLFSQKVNASGVSDIADKSIEFTAKTTYYITKYALKSGWFITRKTTKGVKIVSISLYRASKDAFSSNEKTKHLEKSPEYREYDTKLPPPPPIID